ncbi:activating transcription factor 7-interacting protein 1-like [Sipha flava]|uniref:Activating transcription factor 7-interacting protein 1-like n=2 Tax=Sipha flava TaxID=143950 RepID=A0A8B8GDE7_9HEMI|nr:activating transcription factor 7-interacting protein 1-like [Sipha flava]
MAYAKRKSSINEDRSKRIISEERETYVPVQLLQAVSIEQTSRHHTPSPAQVQSASRETQIYQQSIRPVAFATRKISVPKLNESLKPVIPTLKHPATLAAVPIQRNIRQLKKSPPTPTLNIVKDMKNNALMLVWNMNLNSTYAKVVSYKIYTHKETSSAPLPRFDLWREYKTVSAFDLPMACKLTNFPSNGKYHFAVRAVDVFNRIGPFSLTRCAIVSL